MLLGYALTYTAGLLVRMRVAEQVGEAQREHGAHALALRIAVEDAADQALLVRADDGFHLNENGAEILALDIAQAVRDDLRARGANI